MVTRFEAKMDGENNLPMREEYGQCCFSDIDGEEQEIHRSLQSPGICFHLSYFSFKSSSTPYVFLCRYRWCFLLGLIYCFMLNRYQEWCEVEVHVDSLRAST